MQRNETTFNLNHAVFTQQNMKMSSMMSRTENSGTQAHDMPFLKLFKLEALHSSKIQGPERGKLVNYHSVVLDKLTSCYNNMFRH